MNILYVTSGMNFELRRTSVELIIIKELQKMGHQITIISTDINPYSGKINKFTTSSNETVTKIYTPIEIDKNSVYVLHCSLPKSLGVYCPNASHLAEKIISDYDVVHIASWYHHPGLVFSKIALKYNIPYVFSAFATLQPENRNYKKIQKWVFDQLFTKKMIRNASGLQSVGEKESISYIELGAKSEKIYRIDPAISHENLEVQKHTKILDNLGIDLKQKQYLLFLGRILERKRIDLLILAFAKLIKTKKNIILVIAGPSENSFEQKLKKLARKLGIEEDVKFTGLVLDEEKIEILRLAKLLVHTAKGDIHPLSVEEALTVGTPVIITDCDMPEVSEYKAGMIVDDNIDSIHDALKIVLDDENMLKSFSQNAIKLASEKYRVSHQAKKYENMYINAIKNKS